MFIGHYALAFAAKKAVPQTSLATLFAAVQLADHLWPLLLLLGFEQAQIDPGNTVVTPLEFTSYPYSHSLVGLLIYAAAIATIYFGVSNYSRGTAYVAGGIVSHWVLDVITHKPDMPLGFGDMKFGFGLWNSLEATMIVEGAMFGAGIIIYLMATRSRNWKGIVGFWSLVLVLGVIYFANLFGPPPPNMTAVAIAGNAGWLFVLWAFWVDRHRSVRLPVPS